MLKIFQPSESFSLGLEDRFNQKMVKALNNSGVPCTAQRLWPDFWARRLFFGDVPYGHHIFRRVIAPLSCHAHLSTVRPDDVVWINGPSLPVVDTGCRFERRVLRRGASYVFWVEDDWFSDPFLKQTACARMELADLTVAVTPGLRDRISELYPNKPVIVLEEPIDVDRLNPDAPKINAAPINQDRPFVIWSGRPRAFDKLLTLDSLLQRVYRDIPFTLRIITGLRRPEFPLSIPWEWLPYNREKEAEYAAGAVAGLAPLTRTTYDSCKGNYKVKTYMALGVPPLTSPVGYNNHLIRQGQTGFLLDSEGEWESTLRGLLKDRSLARKVGDAARAHIIKRYSYKTLMPTWAEALQDAFPEKLGSAYPGSVPSEGRRAG